MNRTRRTPRARAIAIAQPAPLPWRWREWLLASGGIALLIGRLLTM